MIYSDFKILPNAGGWNDQFVSESNDLLTHLAGLAWARSLKGDDNGEATNTANDENEFEAEPTDNGLTKVADWQKAFVG